MKQLMRGLGIGRRFGLRIGGDEAAPVQDLDATGVALAGSPDGSWRLRFEQLSLRKLQFQTGEASVDIGEVILKEAQVRLKPPQSAGDDFELIGVSAAEAELQGVQVALSGAFSCASPPTGPWRLEALGSMEGQVHAFISDAAWIFDADVSMTVEQGGLDFNRVSVQHIGPNSSMGISPAGIYIDALRGGRQYLYLFTGAEHGVPGASFEQRDARRRVTDRGRLDLQAFVQGLLDSGMSSSFGRAADRHVEAQMDRTRLNGEFRLGDGSVGTEQYRMVLDGQAQGRNRVQFSAAVLSHKLVLRIPEFSASQAHFELFGLKGRTGPLSARVNVEATDLRGKTSAAACGPALRLEAELVTLRHVAVGEDASADSAEPPAPPG